MKHILAILLLVVGCSGESFEYSGTITDPLGSGGSVGAADSSSGGRVGVTIDDAGKRDAVNASTGGSSAGGTATADACALVTHTNGTGQTWQDCAPLGTWNEPEAIRACTAYSHDSAYCQVVPGCDTKTTWVVENAVPGYRFPIWIYSGPAAGRVSFGDVCSPTGSDWK